jgi:hypothetical protein
MNTENQGSHISIFRHTSMQAATEIPITNVNLHKGLMIYDMQEYILIATCHHCDCYNVFVLFIAIITVKSEYPTMLDLRLTRRPVQFIR